MTSERFPKIDLRQEQILKRFLDKDFGMTLNMLIEDTFPSVVAGYVPSGFTRRRELDQLKEGFRDLITKRYLMSGRFSYSGDAVGIEYGVGVKQNYTLSSLGEDYILEVLWKYE